MAEQELDLNGTIVDDTFCPESKVDRTRILQIIEQRYTRLQTGQRRPSFEYIHTDTIREIFLCYIEDPEVKEKISSMSDTELEQLYHQWYHQIYLPSLKKE